MQITIATASAIASITSGDMPGAMPIRNSMVCSATSAPTISTSPWAKLIRPRMPYTMV